MNKKQEFLKTIRTLSKEDLVKKIDDSKLRLQKLSLAHGITPIANPKMLGQLRKDIARLYTELSHKK